MGPEAREALEVALRNVRYEVIPLEGIAEDVSEYVPDGVKITVTASPSRGLDATLDLTERLASAGYRTVPHLSARLIVDDAHLREILDRLEGLGVDEVFVIAGDAEEPLGTFFDSLELLDRMRALGHPFEAIGVAGYPESHPFISDDLTIQAMWDKRHDAAYIVSQMCFDADTVVGWVHRVRRRGVELPVYVGLAGVINRRRLMGISTKLGLGESARFLSKNRSFLKRLLLPFGYDLERFVGSLAPHLADPDLALRGLHVFTFNELEETERWRRDVLEGLDVPG